MKNKFREVGEFESFKDEHSTGFRPFGIGKSLYFKSNNKLVGTLHSVNGNIAEVKNHRGEITNYQVFGLRFRRFLK